MVSFSHRPFAVPQTMISPRFLWACLLTSLTSLIGLPTQAQITPDQTLGSETSIVTPNVEVRGAISDLIEGGAVRGGNLFHSFSDFSVPEAERVYFANPAGIESILSRVTGDSVSNIFGTLGVDGTADLFFINPNGIVFGPRVTLDVEGSFYGTTANAVEIGEGRFSAVVPEQNKLLEISPSTSFENALTGESGNIINEGLLAIGDDFVLAAREIELQGPVLAFGDISLLATDQLKVSSGVAGYGNIDVTASELKVDGRLSAIATRTLGANPVGDINLNVDRLRLLNGGQVTANTNTNAEGGNVTIAASNSVEVLGTSTELNRVLRSGIQTDTSESGNAGNIAIKTPYLLVGEGARVGSQVLDGAEGDGGNVVVETQRLSLQNGGQITAGTFGPGQGGILRVRNTDSIDVIGSDGDGSPSGLFTATYGYGDADDLIIDTGSLSIVDGGQISTASLGIEQGRGGNLVITATDNIKVVGSSSGDTQFFSTISSSAGNLLAVLFRGSVGDGGDLTIKTRDLTVQNGGRISTEAFGTGRNRRFLGQAGDAGSLDVVATGSVRLLDGSLRTRTSGLGNAGNLDITAKDFYAEGSSEATASTRGQGDGGDLSVVATDTISLVGGGLGTVSFPNPNAGDAGDVYVQTRQLSVLNGAGISTSAIGLGRAGTVNIIATDFVDVIGGEFSSGASLNAILGRDIYRPDDELFSASAIRTAAGSVANNPAGDLTIETGKLRIVDGGSISASSLGENAGGNLNILASESVEIVGASRTGDVSLLSAQATRSGDAGNIQVETALMALRDGGQIIASSREEGNAGNLILTIAERLEIEAGTISTTAERASGGAITVQTEALRLSGDGDIQTNVNSGQGSGGSITLNADSIVSLDDSDILAFSSDGRGGNITLDTLAFFGENYIPGSPSPFEGNERVDVDATGGVASGTILIPDVDFIENNLAELSDNLVNSETLVANSCVIRNSEGAGTITVTGRDRLPQSPDETLSNAYTVGTVQAVIPSAHENHTSITEPQAVYRLADGRLVMHRDCQG